MEKLISSIFAFLFMALCFSSQGREINMDVMKRNKFFHLKKEKVTLPNLISNNSFDGKHFRIVKGKNTNPILFTDQELRLKAATVYYHLEIARAYFVDNLKSDYVNNLPQLIIRIEHTNKFNELGHFANDNLEPQYNNALSIPAGIGYSTANISPWGTEIWFRPSKKIHLSEIDQAQSPQDIKKILGTFRKGVHTSNLQRFLNDFFIMKTYDGVSLQGGLEQFIRTAGSSIILELALSQSDWIEKLLMRKWYHLDSAMIPEIIYHEFSHVALSDHFELNHSTALIEGMADFFAGQISHSKKLALNVKKYNTFNGKKVKTTTLYQQAFESTGMANADFLFGLLWEINNLLGDENLIFKLRTELTTDSNLRSDLIRALFKIIKADERYTQEDELKLYQLLYNRGI